jgi:mono/diheme cytochrome c family protein
MNSEVLFGHPPEGLGLGASTSLVPEVEARKTQNKTSPVVTIFSHLFLSVANSLDRGRITVIFFLLPLATITGCHSDMYDQPRGKPLGESHFFQNGQVARPLVDGTVPHSETPGDELLLTGKVDGRLSDTFPFRVTRDVLDRGHERFNIYCSPCHGVLGDGKGMVVRRGFPSPPSFHSDSLRAKPAGHYVDVMTNGLRKMFSYADRVQPRDRWAIAAYIRALQLSQHAAKRDLSETQRRLAGK